MSKLELNLLGLFNTKLDDAPADKFESNKVRALLAYLAVEAARPHSREMLAALLWPDWPDSAARSNLRYALADLRKAIGDHNADPPFLLISRDSLQINSASDHHLDVAEFTELANGASQPAEDRIERLCDALALYRGEFLDGFSVPDAAPFEDWLRLKREQLHRLHLKVLRDLAGAYEQDGDITQALAHARRGVELEPWQEGAQRQLMRLLALDGQRSAALAQYEACRRSLADELGVEPSLETIALYESIRDGTLEAHAGAVSRLEELPPAPGMPPFMGMQYFDEHDADLYFGRELLTARLVGRLGEPDGRRFLAVVGASGSGKSSLVRAGLVPALRRGEVLVDGSYPPRWSHRWLVHVITPTAHPLEALATSLTREGGPVSTTAALIDDLASDPRSLHLYARRMTHIRNAPRLLLVVDQFEELFTLCRSESERGAFIENLLLAAGGEMPAPEEVLEGVLSGQSEQDSPVVADRADRDGPLIAVIALRADFYSHCAQYALLRSALSLHQEYIGPMSPDELRTAIEEPARQNEWEFEPGLVDLILREVSKEPGRLPLLSHALLETWHRRRGRALTLKGYAEAGGIHRAIAQTAESVYTDLTPERRDLARRIFLRLTELGEGTQDTRRRANLSELVPNQETAPQIEAVLNTLVEARLVTAGEGTVEVAHEALIREWPALRQWLDEDRESLRLQRHLTEAALAWEAMERDPGELYRGARLAQALEWASQPENEKSLNALEREFLQASQGLEQQKQAERELQRQRELEAARKVAEAERQRAEEQAHSASRLRRRALYLVGALLLALIMTVVAGAFANRNSNLALQNAESAWFARTQQAVAEAEANSRATQQVLAQSEASARATAEAVAVLEKENAQGQAELASSREFALAAINSLETDPERSILLALNALDTAYTRQAEDALHNAVQASRLRMALTVHADGAYSVAYSPDGTNIVTGDGGNVVKVWEAASGRELFDLPGSVARYSPDGSRLATGTVDGGVTLWDPATGQQILAFSGHPEHIVDLHFSPDGQLLVSSSLDDTFIVWDTLTGQEVFSSSAVLSGFYTTNNVVFTPDGRSLLSNDVFSTSQVEMSVWGVERGWSLLNQLPGIAWFVFSPDGRWLASPGGDLSTDILLWDISALSGDNLASFELPSLDPLVFPAAHRGVIHDIAFNTDGTRVASASSDGTARVWSLSQEGLEPLMTLGGHVGEVSDVDFSPDGAHLATASNDGVKVWDITPSGTSEWFTLAAHSDTIYRIALTADGRYLATASLDGSAKIWDLASGEELLDITAHGSPLYGVALSPDGSLLATAGYDNVAKIWKLQLTPGAADAELQLTLGGHAQGPPIGGIYTGLTSAAFSPDGSMLATGGVDSMARVWDTQTGEELLAVQAEPHGSGVTRLTFSPDGLLLATANDTPAGVPSLAKVWDVASGEEITTFYGHGKTGRIWGIDFSPDGERLATGGSAVLKIWDAHTGQELLDIAGHTGVITGLDFSPDGKYLVTSSGDGTARVWDATTGEELHLYTSLSGRIFDVTYTPDGKNVIASSSEGIVYGYIQDLDNLIRLAKGRLTRRLTLDECRQYLHLEACPAEGH